MIPARFLRQTLLIVCMYVMTAFASAQGQAANQEYKPEVGQPGKDVVWVPTPQALANKMLSLAKVTPQDYVIDLGSGDGRIVITAAKIGARALGIEYNPDLVALSKRNAEKEGVGAKAQFIQADLFKTDFSQATTITMFLLPYLNLQLRPKILDLKPGTRVVSNSFDMEDWRADQIVTVTPEEGCTGSYCEAYLWIVPAKVEGTWKLPQGEIVLTQSFQKISGTLKSGAEIKPITNGKLNGDQISFTVGDVEYSGRTNGDVMQVQFKNGGNTVKWNATRVSVQKS